MKIDNKVKIIFAVAVLLLVFIIGKGIKFINAQAPSEQPKTLSVANPSSEQPKTSSIVSIDEF